MTNIIMYIVLAVVILIIIPLLIKALGIVIIPQDRLGIVIKKISSKHLPTDKIIATDGEAGYQAKTLSPGWYFFMFPWQYKVIKEKLISIPQGEIGLVVANDGKELSPDQILGASIDCNNFQDAEAFLKEGGQKGRQNSILTAGTYRINTALFKIITKLNCGEYNLSDDVMEVYRVNPDNVGIVTTKDGLAIEQGEIVGAIIPDHENFQDPQKFIDNKGRRGLQEQILLSGSWNLNPWFVEVEQIPMTLIPIGFVGVVISFAGKAHEDISGDGFKHGDLVENGHKGIWSKPLDPGKYSLNTKILSVQKVPTTNIALNWANRTEAHKYDQNLSSITVRAKDGFVFNLDVTQIIHIAAKLAPKVIQRVGTMENLVGQVLEPIIGNYFRNAVQENQCIDFVNQRSEMQLHAKGFIDSALLGYDIESVDTLIGDITLPQILMETLTNRKIAEEQKMTFETQQTAQEQRKTFEKSKSEAEMQGELVKADYNVVIASKNADAAVKIAEGEAKSITLKGSAQAEVIRVTGAAEAEAYEKGKSAIGEENFSRIKIFEEIAKGNITITPEILVTGSDTGNGFMSMLMRDLQKNNNK